MIQLIHIFAENKWSIIATTEVVEKIFNSTLHLMYMLFESTKTQAKSETRNMKLRDNTFLQDL